MPERQSSSAQPARPAGGDQQRPATDGSGPARTQSGAPEPAQPAAEPGPAAPAGGDPGPAGAAPDEPPSADRSPDHTATVPVRPARTPDPDGPNEEKPTVPSPVPGPTGRTRPEPAPADPPADRDEPPTAAVPTTAMVGASADTAATQALRRPDAAGSTASTASTASVDSQTERLSVPPVAAPDRSAGPGGAGAAGSGADGPAADGSRPGGPGPGGPGPAGPGSGGPGTGDPGSGGPGSGGSGTAGGWSRRRMLVAAGAVAGLLGVLYGADLALGSGHVPRGVLVADVPVGGLPLAAAERELRAQIEPRTARPVAVTAGEATSELDPNTAGLSVDWPATMARAGDQPLNPITRIASFFTEREVGVATATDQAALDSALAALGSIVDRPPAEGSVRFEGTNPIPVDPVPGRALDVPAAESVLQRAWALGRPVALPLVELPPSTDADDVARAIDDVARPAVSAPLVVTGEQGVQATLGPEAIAGLLSFRADQGELVPEINIQGATEALDPQLASSETPGRDASLDFSSGQPVVTPSKDGRGIDYEATLKDVISVLTGSGERKITAIYAEQPAELTTDELNKLGITGVIGEFTTRGFAPDSGKNIRRAAQMINGMIVEPGATFSLNKATEPRIASNGFVEAGIINDGHASRGVGGGVSQVATTLYNAAYFAGMTDVEHKEHSFYISRYPAGREATVFGNAIDMRFRNDNPTGVLIQTAWTPQSITIRLFGTKRYDVTSTPGSRTNPTEPEEVSIPEGEPCVESNGAPGFTVTDTRTLREISTGQVRRETRTVKYNPSPIVSCEDDD